MTIEQLVKNQNNSVLIVDDTDENLKFLSNILIADGYSVAQANSGEQAFVSLKAQWPGIILLDVMMPEMDGFEVCRKLKADPETSNIPVIFISALGDEQSKATGFDLGAVDFITKPFRKVEILARVKTHLNLYQLQFELKEKNNILEAEILIRKQAEAALLESEERYRTTLYSIGDGVITTDANGRVKLMNGVAEQLTQWQQEFAVGKTLEEVFSIINEDTREQVEIPVRKVLREGAIVGLANHTLLIAKDGAERPIADSGAPIRNEKGEIEGVVLVFRDQTEERKAEKALKESEKRFKLLYENAPLSYQSLDNQARLVDVNPTWLQTLGYTRDEVIGRSFGDFMTPESAELIQARFANFIAVGEIHNYEFEMIRKDGTHFPVSYDGLIGHDELGHFKQTHCIFTDITQRKKAETALRESEERFRSIIESSPIGKYIYQLQKDGRLIFMGANPSADRIIGIDHQSLMGKTIQQAFPNLAETGVPEMYARIAKGEIGTQSFEIDYSENQINGFFQITVFRIGNNLIAVDFTDISDRKRTEIALRKNEEKFRSLFENGTVGTSMTSIDGTMTINARMHEMLGYSEAEFRNKKWQEITHPDDIKMSEDVINKLIQGQAQQLRFEKRYLHKNGSIVWTDVSTTLHRDENDQPDFFITSISDITERKQFELKLQRSEQELKKAQQITHIGSWYLNLANNEVVWTEELFKMYGFDPTLPVPPYSEHMKLFTSESWELLSKSLANTAETGSPYELELKTVREDGSNGWMWVLGETVKDVAGKTIGLWGAAQDISARKQAEQALFESEEMMRNSQSVAHICSYSTNLNVNDIGTRSWKCSPEFYKIFGINQSYPHTIEGWANFIHPDYREEMVAYHEYVIKERIPFEHEYKIIRIEDGAERWVFGTGKLELDEKGNPIRMHGAIQDITESKRHLETIQNERQLLRTLIDNLPVTVYIKDKNARKIVANTLDLATIGIMDDSHVLGKTELELFDNEIGRRGYEDDLNVIRTAKPVLNREEYFFSDKGEIHWLLTSKMPLLDENGKPTGLVGISRDITEQKKAESQIQKLTESIEQSPSTIIITDINGAIEYVNQKFCEITGYTKEEALGQNPRILKSGEMSDESYRHLWVTISSGEVWRGEFHNRKKNGELYWEWATLTSIKNDRGEITNYIAIKEDISLRKEMEVDLIIAKEKAEESDRLKSAFLANMSHEIRTPLNSIIGFSELLSDSDFRVDQKIEFVDHIIRNGNNLLNIISDIVDISKIEAGEITIRKSKVHVKNLMNEIHSLHTLNVEEKLLKLKSTCLISEKDEDIFVIADKERLQQIFNNLISNALKFTATGYIEVGCELSGDMIKFYVRDTGIGIPKAFLDLIFDRFRQVETSLTRKSGGNGLGLAISKNLVELMGGTIWVESETGKGSTFYFTLPATSR